MNITSVDYGELLHGVLLKDARHGCIAVPGCCIAVFFWKMIRHYLRKYTGIQGNKHPVFHFSGSSGHYPWNPPSKQHQTGSFHAFIIALFSSRLIFYGYFENTVFQWSHFATFRYMLCRYRTKYARIEPGIKEFLYRLITNVRISSRFVLFLFKNDDQYIRRGRFTTGISTKVVS
jgi:hypothetical protein